MKGALNLKLGSMVLFFAGIIVSSAQAAEKPNILLIYADDFGWTGTSARMSPDRDDSRSDYYETPNIERLAQQGMRFSRGYSPGPNCSPSRHALLSGMCPAKNRKCDISGGRGPTEHVRWLAGRNGPDPLTEVVTFPKLLRDHAGYATAHFGKWHLPGDPGENGYDEHDGSRGNAAGGGDEDPKYVTEITTSGIRFMRKQVEAGKPFYLQISHFATHLPIQHRPETLLKYENKSKGERHTNPAYAAMTAELDRGVGMVLDEIDRLGIAKSTYVLFTADNGALRGLDDASTSNDPLNFGKPQVWEGGIRVPFIVRGPGVAANSWRHQAVVGYDLYSTFCEWAGIKDRVPDCVEGGSLAATLASGEEVEIKRKNSFLVFHFPNYVLGKGKDARPQSAIMIGDLKLMKIYEWDRPKLFDLSTDIGEKDDLWEKMPERARMMHSTLQEYLEQVNAPMPTLNPDVDMTVEEWSVWSKAQKKDNVAPKKAAKKAGKKSPKKEN
jgi:arylsulfatase A